MSIIFELYWKVVSVVVFTFWMTGFTADTISSIYCFVTNKMVKMKLFEEINKIYQRYGKAVFFLTQLFQFVFILLAVNFFIFFPSFSQSLVWVGSLLDIVKSILVGFIICLGISRWKTAFYNFKRFLFTFNAILRGEIRNGREWVLSRLREMEKK